MGKVRIVQEHDGKPVPYTLEIRQGNCLAVLLHVHKLTPEEKKTAEPGANYRHTLYTFFGDEQHCKNIVKHHGDIMIGEKTTKVELNLYYKECKTLLKYFTLSGHKVTCYYKEPKGKKK